MKSIFLIFVFISFMFANSSVYDAKDVKQINNTLYDKHTKKLINGTINSYFKSGKLQESIPCIDGLPNGTAIEYNKKGKIIIKRVYKDGIVTSITHF